MQAWIRTPTKIYNALTAIAGARLNTRGSFEPTHFVWSRGLALLCDHNGGFDFVRRQRGSGRAAIRFAPRAYDDVRDGDLVWVRLIALPQFVSEALPHIRAKFALVTGDEDWAMPSEFERSSAIIGNSNVVCWFTQNFDGTDTSGKLLPMPIGSDFHTLSNRRRWGHLQATPRQQEIELELLRAGMPANADRLVRVHADFHFNKSKDQRRGDSRVEVESMLSTNPNVDFQLEKISRLDLWREKTRYAFVASPHGHGLDCHRTWESLVLGNIPIVKRSSLDELYDGLPVVIVSEWDEITTDNLRRWHATHRAAFLETEVQERLTNRYWIARMRRITRERMHEGPGQLRPGPS